MTNNAYSWSFLSIEKKHQREIFDCGNQELNQYLKKYARQNHQKGIAKTFVATPNNNPIKIDGYYTVSASTIAYQSISNIYQKKLPNYPVPALLIGKLAVDKTAQGKGLGSELLVNALERAVRTSQEIGIFAVRVDAIDLQAKEFYLKHEFIPFQDHPLSLFLPVETIIKEFF